MTDVFLAAYVIMPTAIIVGATIAILALRREAAHRIHPGE